MSKFRARQLDATKPIPIYLQEDLCDYSDINNASNRTVPQMPTGMEKEEETEHHLQQAIFHHRVIPVPEVYAVSNTENGKIYPSNYKQPRQLIHIHPFSAEQDIPDYDMDSEDERWLSQQATKGDLLPLPLHPPQFEEMMDRLEKSSGLKAVTLHEAKVLLKDDDDLITAVYDYWLNKRLRLQHALIPQVKSEKGVGSAPSDPYVAFRKRTEKMQTRKNRKNDESSYEKMLKLKRDLTKSSTMLQMVSRREKTKRELMHLQIEIFEKRYEMQDWSGSVLSELVSSRASMRSAFTPLVSNHLNSSSTGGVTTTTTTSSSSAVSAGSGGGVSGASSGWLKVPAGHSSHHSSSNGSSQHLSGHRDKAGRKREKCKRERKYRKLKHHPLHSITGQPASSSSQPQQPQPQHLGYTHPPDPFLLADAYPQQSCEEDVATHSPGAASTSDEDSLADGLFTFVRRHHCQYYAPHEDGMWASPLEGGGGASNRYSLSSFPQHYKDTSPFLPSSPPSPQHQPQYLSSAMSSAELWPSSSFSGTQQFLPSSPCSNSSFQQQSGAFSNDPWSLPTPCDTPNKYAPATEHVWAGSQAASQLEGPPPDTDSAAALPQRHMTLARRRVGRGGRMWVDRIGLSSSQCPDGEGVRHHEDVSSNTIGLLDRVHSAVNLWSEASELSILSSLPTFVAPPNCKPEVLSDGDTDMEVDVESVVTSSRVGRSSLLSNQSGASSSHRRYNNQSAVSASRHSSPVTFLLSAEVVDGLYMGAGAELTAVLETGGKDSGVADQDSQDPWLLQDVTSRGDNIPSMAGSSAAFNSFTSLPAIDSTPASFMDQSDSELYHQSPSRNQLLHPKNSPLRPSLRRYRHTGPRSPPDLEHSSQFSMQPSSKFVTSDSVNSSSSPYSSLAGLTLTSLNSISSYPPKSSSSNSSDIDVISVSHSSVSTCSSTSTSVSSSSLSLCTSNRQTTLSNQSCNYVLTNSSLSSAQSTVSASDASSSGCRLSSGTSSTCAASSSGSSVGAVSSSSSGAVSGAGASTRSSAGAGSSTVSSASSASTFLTTANSLSSKAPVAWTSESSGSVSNCASGGVLSSSCTNSFNAPHVQGAGDPSLLTATTTSDNNSGNCVVNSVDSPNKLTSISTTLVSSSLLQSTAAVTSNNQQRHSSFSINNNSSAHQVVYLNNARNNNGNSVLSNSPSLRSHHKVLTTRTTSNVTSSSESNSIKTSNSSSMNSSDVNNCSNITNGPTRNNVILTKSSSNTASTTTPIVKCAKLDQCLFRDS